jgi:hypothetical protein
VHQHLCWLLLVALTASLATGCGGGTRRVGDGSWYGKVVKVDVAQRTLTFAPACRFSRSGRWIAVPAPSRVPAAVPLSSRADLEIYYRPKGKGAKGHGQSADLTQLADVVRRGHLPASPPGWFVRVRNRVAVSVDEDSGIRSSGKADRRTFACVWSRSTQAFVSSFPGALVTGAQGASPLVKSATAASGNVRARIFYSIPRGEAYFVVRLVVDRAGKRVFDARVAPCSAIKYCGTKPVAVNDGKALTVRDLDGDDEPEVLLDLYSGAAHCCWWSRIYRWDAHVGTYTTLAHVWGNVDYGLADLNRDQHTEFLSADDRFAYVFTSFARSSFPLQVWTYRAAQLVPTTRSYPALVAKDAAKQWRWYRGAVAQGEVRGFLAAWAADECLLGRCRAAFARLRSLSRTFSDPLDVQHSGSAAEYLRHLRSFLRRTGYLR